VGKAVADQNGQVMKTAQNQGILLQIFKIFL
jgi:hypothetical protein